MKKIISGKVREVYEISEERLAIVTTDRISAFDVILPTPITDKGRVLNSLSSFWFDYTKDIVKNHMVSEDIKDMPEELQGPEFEGRTILVKKLKMLPFEFIVRGYLFGSMWKEYQKTGGFCGTKFPEGMQQAEKLPEPILTPSIKAEEGHDVNVSFEYMEEKLGHDMAKKVCDTAMALYKRAYDYAYERGIIIADTKFEFGLDENGELVVGDEVLTPDSSRFWSRDAYKTGTSPESFDKQYVRDWLTENGLDGKTPPPELPEEVVRRTQEKYLECRERLVGKQ
ncbi:MAG: phosphoribosylaminoimidazolesuccinocarboxamide synthase [Acutalibacter sp.]|jgi:phosphoribosylaminoimidazole-succinocarboxamide synthase|uniref:phosphoribosylaminoimidazolesuccinocarboxamide synthase n=1 Tax=Acutalibacter sp. TaxID=1918636 RepID=UPI00216B6DEF|nr:phosphoribosylaminoimidazolesuccinocarboxamide synthase [Acutalibacter sp.]MCI9225599.1 phosphoribosylaminoimidazolesuccinocarboxamide synthase [Acutalibacter sp.]